MKKHYIIEIPNPINTENHNLLVKDDDITNITDITKREKMINEWLKALKKCNINFEAQIEILERSITYEMEQNAVEEINKLLVEHHTHSQNINVSMLKMKNYMDLIPNQANINDKNIKKIYKLLSKNFYYTIQASINIQTNLIISIKNKIEFQLNKFGINWTPQQINQICQDPLTLGNIIVNLTVQLDNKNLGNLLNYVEQKNQIMKKVNKSLDFLQEIINNNELFITINSDNISDTESIPEKIDLRVKYSERINELITRYIMPNIHYKIMACLLAIIFFFIVSALR